MRSPIAFLPLAVFLATPALAQTAERTGHYYLHGVMETGSELVLLPDGRFQWYLAYGALDLFAEGKWTERNGAVILTAEKTKDVPAPSFQTLTLTIKDKALIPPDGHGAYIRPADDKD